MSSETNYPCSHLKCLFSTSSQLKVLNVQMSKAKNLKIYENVEQEINQYVSIVYV